MVAFLVEDRVEGGGLGGVTAWVMVVGSSTASQSTKADGQMGKGSQEDNLPENQPRQDTESCDC